jgi:hypothetical protein
MALILGSVTVLTRGGAMVAGATAGIVAFLVAVWYASNPFLRKTRRYLLLRAELVQFIDIARALNYAVVDGASPEVVDRAKAQLHDAVDRIVAAAGKTQ